MKLCPKCGSLAFYNSYFGKMMCNTCEYTWKGGRTMNELINAFSKLGIAIKNTDNTFRSFNDVMIDLSDVWDKLEEETQG
jgi:hypothetical protein